MRTILLILISIQAICQGEPECKKIYDPWKDTTWTKSLRGKFLLDYLRSTTPPCSPGRKERTFTIDGQLADSISKFEIDSICKIQGSSWMFNDRAFEYAPTKELHRSFGRIGAIIIITDCPPTRKGPFFIVYTKNYIARMKRKARKHKIFSWFLRSK